MLDSPSWVRCSHATQGKIDLSSQSSDLSLTFLYGLTPVCSNAILIAA